ncbi:hypothetical protein DSO57_1026304 [Entomophthora muscae]|uniref:Uncharacterized protein n=1 Tax=Entomophthora muscae TaxID=34485 RepID=A0ACC2U0B1_9FUNG|nr:hypothetical protein DSO57_1026304 [Entomophthora muscae]
MATNELDAMLISSSPVDFDVIIPDLSGFPSLTVPAGFDATSTPMGITIYARRNQECLVLALAELLGQGTEFKRSPPQYLFLPTAQ